MKRLVLCEITIETREYMQSRSKSKKVLKQVAVGEGQTPEEVVQEHYRKLSDPYGTYYRVSVEEVEVIGW